MKKLVEFCSNNYFLETEATKKILEAKQDYEIMESNCLGYCEDCEVMPFALVEGDFVKADNSTELIIKIENRLKEKEKMAKIFDEL